MPADIFLGVDPAHLDHGHSPASPNVGGAGARSLGDAGIPFVEGDLELGDGEGLRDRHLMLRTLTIFFEDRALEIVFDFNRHVLEIRTSEGWERRLPLEPMAVADFFEMVTVELGKARVHVDFDEHPCEIPDAIPFSADRVHAAYDRDFAQRFWKALLEADRVLKQFRTGFIGKCSPVHFFWGSFDLAVTRFSGRRAPEHPGGVPGLADDCATPIPMKLVALGFGRAVAASITRPFIRMPTPNQKGLERPRSNRPPRFSVRNCGSFCCPMTWFELPPTLMQRFLPS
jgi:hypothetical protein